MRTLHVNDQRYDITNMNNEIGRKVDSGRERPNSYMLHFAIRDSLHCTQVNI